ncbi:hypothetical protein AYI69_g4287 [Smittium culicis]|uniref:Uncharacterized protein n=1 Tax=Smittium culicis TaxID=133412 RepID=A0A1R1YEZ4_9FUNG|nr:hypothetical protein AYI69_g4287 [Smittium culicis]
MEVQELRKERALPREMDMQEVDENYVTRPPIVDLKVSQGLIDIMPHIEEEFYKSIGCEEETKEVIQACPRKPDGKCIPGHGHSGKATTAGGNNDKTIIRPRTIGQCDRYNKASQEDQTSQALSGAPARPSSRRATRDVQESLGPTYGQHVGQEHRGEGVSYTLQNPRKNPAVDNAPSTLQEEAETRGQQGPDRRADSVQGFHVTPGSERRISTHTDTQGMSQVTALGVEWPTVSVQVLTWAREQGIRMVAYLDDLHDHRRVQGYLQSTHNHDPSQAIRTWIHSKPREVRNYSDTFDQPPGNEHQLTGNYSQGTVIQGPGPPPGSQQACKLRKDHPQWIGKLHRKSSSHVSGASTGSPHAQEITGTQERHVQVVEFMDIDSPPDSTCPGEPPILEGTSGKMEWQIIPTGSSRDGNLYRCQRHSMGGVVGHSVLVYSDNKTSLCVHEDAWRNYFSKASGDNRKNMDTLHGYQHTSSSDVCAIDIEPRRRTEPVDCSDRMVTFHRNIQSDQRSMGTPRCGHVCQKDQQEIVPYYSWFLDKDAMDEPVLLPAVESDLSDCHEGQTRENDYNFGEPNVKVGDNEAKQVVPDPKSGKSPMSENKSWYLMAWRISGVPSRPKASPNRPLISS